ncbi:hypothetical protein [Paenibacillus polymyxa]
MKQEGSASAALRSGFCDGRAVQRGAAGRLAISRAEKRPPPDGTLSLD